MEAGIADYVWPIKEIVELLEGAKHGAAWNLGVGVGWLLTFFVCVPVINQSKALLYGFAVPGPKNSTQEQQ